MRQNRLRKYSLAVIVFSGSLSLFGKVELFAEAENNESLRLQRHEFELPVLLWNRLSSRAELRRIKRSALRLETARE